MKNLKRVLAFLIVLAMCLPCGTTVFAYEVDLQSMIVAKTAGNTALLEQLIHTEEPIIGEMKMTVSVSTDSISKIVNKDILGIQDEFGSQNDYGFLKEDTDELTDGYIKIANDTLTKVTTAHWGGSTGELIDPLKNLGPREERENSVFLGNDWTPGVTAGDIASGPVDIGIVEYIKMCQAMNPNVKFIIELPLGLLTPERCAQYAEFLLGDKSTAWGAKRAALGIEDPISLVGFELGNEQCFTSDWESYGYPFLGPADKAKYDAGSDSAKMASREAFYLQRAQAYSDISSAAIDAIHEKYPNAEFFMGVCKYSEDREWAPYWVENVSKILGSKINDKISYHHYLSLNPVTATGCATQLKNFINTYTGATGRDPKFVITGHIGRDIDNDIESATWNSALTIAYFAEEMIKRNDVICAGYHSFAGSNGAVFKRFGNQYVPMAINFVLKAYTKLLGDGFVNSNKSGDSNCNAVVTKCNDGRLVIALINGNNDKKAKATLSGAGLNGYKLINSKTFTAPNWYSYVNCPEDAQMFEPTSEDYDRTTTTSYTLPPRSIVFLTLEKTAIGTEVPSFNDPEYIPQIVKNTADATAGDIFVANGAEPDSVIYVEKAPDVEKNGVMTYIHPTTVRRVVNIGNTAVDILVSDDGFAYKKLGTVEPGEAFINTLTAHKFKYVRTTGGSVRIYSMLGDDIISTVADPLSLEAVVGGIKLSGANYSVSDNKVAYVSFDMLYALKNGTVEISASGENGSTDSYSATVLQKAEETESFDSYGTVAEINTPIGNAVTKAHLAGDWYLTQNYGGTVNKNSKAKIEDGTMMITGCIINDPIDPRIAYVQKKTPYAGISDNYTISYDGKKSSVNCGVGIKFHMYDNGHSYYMLWLNGADCRDQNVWSFYKVKDGLLVPGSVQNGESFSSTTASDGGTLSGQYHVDINVADGNISWTVNGNRYNISGTYVGEGSYSDNDFPMVSVSDTRLGFACNASSAQEDNFNSIDNVTIKGDITYVADVFSDDFSSYTGNEENSYTQQERTSKTKNAKECTSGGKPTPYLLWAPIGSLSFFTNLNYYYNTISAADGLKIGGDSNGAFTSYTDRFTSTVINPEYYENELSNDYTLQFDYSNSSVYATCGVRFGMSADQKNYYLLAVGPNANGSKSGAAWALYKSNGTGQLNTTPLLKSDYFNNSTSFASNGKVKISVNGGEIKVTVTNDTQTGVVPVFNETKTYTDSAPLGAGYIGFIHAAASGKAESYINNIKLKNNVEDGSEPENCIYRDITQPIIDNVMTLANETLVNKIVNRNVTPVTVSVSADGSNFKKIGTVGAGKTLFITGVTQNCKYVRIDGASDNVIAYTDLNGATVSSVDNAIGTLIRLGGIDNPESCTITSDNPSVVYADESGAIVPLKKGSATLTATYGTDKATATVKVEMQKVESNLTKLPEMTETTLGEDPISIGGGWTLYSGQQFNTMPKISTSADGLTLTGTTCTGGIANNMHSVLKYENIPEKMPVNQTIHYSATKGDARSGIFLRFMTANNSDDTYYTLAFFSSSNRNIQNGMKSNGIWAFAKVVDGKVIPESIVNGPAWEGDDTSGRGYGHALSGDLDVTITIKNGTVIWSITGCPDTESVQTWQGIYNDPDPLTESRCFGIVPVDNSSVHKSLTIEPTDVPFVIKTLNGSETMFFDASGMTASDPKVMISSYINGRMDSCIVNDISVGNGVVNKIALPAWETGKTYRAFAWDFPDKYPLCDSMNLK